MQEIHKPITAKRGYFISGKFDQLKRNIPYSAIVDANQRYRFANRTYEVWFSCSRDEILGKSVRELLGEAAYQVAQPHINRALSGQLYINIA